MENRMENMLEISERAFQPMFAKSMEMIMEVYQKPEVYGTVKDAFIALCGRIREQKKEEVRYLGACYLLSSLATGSYELLLTAYDGNFYLDGQQAEYPLILPYFYETFQRDMSNVFKALQKKFIRIREWEKERIRRNLMEYYYAAMRRVFTDWKEELMQIDEVKALHDRSPFLFFFGRYQGEGVIL